MGTLFGLGMAYLFLKEIGLIKQAVKLFKVWRGTEEIHEHRRKDDPRDESYVHVRIKATETVLLKFQEDIAKFREEFKEHIIEWKEHKMAEVQEDIRMGKLEVKQDNLEEMVLELKRGREQFNIKLDRITEWIMDHPRK